MAGVVLFTIYKSRFQKDFITGWSINYNLIDFYFLSYTMYKESIEVIIKIYDEFSHTSN